MILWWITVTITCASQFQEITIVTLFFLLASKCDQIACVRIIKKITMVTWLSCFSFKVWLNSCSSGPDMALKENGCIHWSVTEQTLTTIYVEGNRNCLVHEVDNRSDKNSSWQKLQNYFLKIASSGIGFKIWYHLLLCLIFFNVHIFVLTN